MFPQIKSEHGSKSETNGSFMDKNRYFIKNPVELEEGGGGYMYRNRDVLQNGLVFQAIILRQDSHFCQKKIPKLVWSISRRSRKTG